MKKLIVSVLCLWLMSVGKAGADNTLSVANVTVPQGGQATMEIVCSFETVFKGFQLDLELNNDGMVTPTMSGVKPVATLEFSGTDHNFSNSQLNNGEEPPVLLPKYRYLCVSMTSGDVLPTSGKLMNVVLNADANATVGQTYPVKLSGIEFTGADNIRYVLADVPFSITIGEPADTRTLLSEDATSAPDAASNVDVRVKRTIVKDVWNTICLPFAMNATQVKTAFGDGVKLGSFKSWKTTAWNDDDKPTAIEVTFEEETEIAANKPYIIKVENDFTEFTADGVTIDPKSVLSTTVGSYGKRTFGSFTGTYTPITIDEECLFLSGNNFWYSTGNTTTKGFRAYFYFQDVLASYNSVSTARMKIMLDETTGMGDAVRQNEKGEAANDKWYTIGGLSLEGEPTAKGVYVNNGRVIIK